MTILKAAKIKKVFLDPSPIEIISDASISIEQGSSLAIIGASGEGKSTLLHILGTLEPPTEGELFICDEKVSSSNAASLRRDKIGFVFQHFHLLDEYSVLDNILMPARIARKSTVDSSIAYERAIQLAEKVGLSHRLNFPAKQLSGGEKQRVAIARALCNDPPLILADEPSGNLDHNTANQIHSILLSLTKELKKTLIVVTHNIDFAKNCDQLLRLSGGKLYPYN